MAAVIYMSRTMQYKNKMHFTPIRSVSKRYQSGLQRVPYVSSALISLCICDAVISTARGIVDVPEAQI